MAAFDKNTPIEPAADQAEVDTTFQTLYSRMTNAIALVAAGAEALYGAGKGVSTDLPYARNSLMKAISDLEQVRTELDALHREELSARENWP
jgi:hypothetical protein